MSIQGFLNCQKLNNNERYIYVGDSKNVEVEAIENFKLLLKTKFYLDLNENLLFHL